MVANDHDRENVIQLVKYVQEHHHSVPALVTSHKMSASVTNVILPDSYRFSLFVNVMFTTIAQDLDGLLHQRSL
jgi:hypothetical protein